MTPRSILILPVLALSVQFAIAQSEPTPPACMLAAVNTQPDPSNVAAICAKANSTAIVDYICKNCGDNTKVALSEFEAGCLGAGLDIATENACSPNSQNNPNASDTATHSMRMASGTSTAASSTSGTANAAEGTNAAVDLGLGNGVGAAILFVALAVV